MDDVVSWQVELAIKPGELENFRDLTGKMIESTKDEPGVLIYERFVSADGAVVYVYERYADSASAVAHLQAFGRLYGEQFSRMVDRKRFTVFGCPSAELRSILDRFNPSYLASFGRISSIR